MQSQEFAGSVWAVGQRCSGWDESAILQAFDAGALVRTHVLRPTWHLVAPADLRWLQALTASRVHAANATYYRRSGLDAPTLARAADLICGALGGGTHLTRAELGDVLVRGGIDPGDTLRLSLIVMWCELEALVCSGGRRGRQQTYALVQERIPAAGVLDGDEALGELARRYFASHGPAGVADFAWWSGLTVADARRAVEIAGDPEDAGAATRSALASVPATSPSVHLLPNYDEYVVAYQDRSALFGTPELARDLAGMGVLGAAPVIHRGQVAGHWKRAAERGRVVLQVSLRRDLGRSGERALAAAAGRYAKFLGRPVDVRSGRIEP